ncbi:cyclic nucleotide-binding domain-containing protein [Oscillatoria amoena NRMC-F 0135]|nr:cyclic nucleotide-binding domain-containing protein [Oscillatoria laete-virens]MDL5050361.1 cyclic nucleotide-binding domain-containing protein [Oscillatoria amoena NRMC-F 0135]
MSVITNRRDFFSFCTSLDLNKRRMLGQLSKVIHFPPNVLIFKQGEPSDALYIINKGVVEVYIESQDGKRKQSLGYLSRGDCLGEIGILTGAPRSGNARTCEACSLQYFSEENFYKMIEVVPSFFHYLSTLLAERLRKTSHMALMNSNCLELSGNLANFDLVTLFQTIEHSSKTGELKIFDANSNEMGKFFFNKGTPTHARFGRLKGVQAVWQFFLVPDLEGNFAFYVTDTASEMDTELESQYSTTEILMNALQMRDEFQEMSALDEDSMQPFIPLGESLSVVDNKYGAVQESVFASLKISPKTVKQLCEELPYCEYDVYSAVQRLVETGQIK